MKSTELRKTISKYAEKGNDGLGREIRYVKEENFENMTKDLFALYVVSQRSELLNGYEIWKRLVNIKTENYTASTLIEMYLKTI
tara:strand:- start:75 stop:326 length:252 start_codon:yes stop_codon:yes gene_type:complete